MSRDSTRGLLFYVREGSDCVLRYLPAVSASSNMDEIVYGKALYAVRMRFHKGGFQQYVRRLRALDAKL